MACQCECPVPVVTRKRGWSRDEWSEATLCGNCGEPVGAEHRSRRSRSAKRKARRPRERAPRQVAAAPSPLASLVNHDRIRITAVHEPWMLTLYRGWYASRDPEMEAKQMVGTVFVVVRSASSRRRYGRSRRAVRVELRGTGRCKGWSLSVGEGEIGFERVPHVWE